MFRWVERSGELELHVEAQSEAAVLEEATRALAELLGGPGEARGGQVVTRQVAVQADDRATLLAAWVEELVFLAESEGAIPGAVRFEALDARGLRASVELRPGPPARRVAGVAYHRLTFDQAEDGWRATVALDV
jgi:SHS2 domain-containing protein